MEPDRRKKRDAGGGFPPIDWDDFGGGGGGGGDDDSEESSGDESGDRGSRRPAGTTELGVGLGLIAISSLFLIFFAAYLFLWRTSDEWPPAGAPSAPRGLWISTVLLVVSSIVLSRGVAAGKRGEREVLMRWMLVTLVLGVLFLGVQLQVWRDLHNAGLLPSSNGYGAIFYTLTGLHGLHIFGGLAYLTSVLCRIWGSKEAPLPQNTVRLCGVYWHFMGVIWIVLFCALYFPN